MLRVTALGLLFALFDVAKAAVSSSYAVWAADSAIFRGQGNGIVNGAPGWSYEHGEFQWALRLLYESTGNVSYFNYIKNGADTILSNDGRTIAKYNVSEYQLDSLRVGPTFLYLHEQTGDRKYRTAANVLRRQFNTHPRTPAGQFWHKAQYFDQGWLDGVYMGDVFYADYTNRLEPNNRTAWDDVNLQLSLMYENTVQVPSDANYTGLLYHGYDASFTAVWASPDRGHSLEVWDRALGWYFMTLVDLLDFVPVQKTLHTTALKQLQTLAPFLVAQADPVWWLVITEPGREGNYFESSAAAMYVYSLLKGLRLGFLDDPDGGILAVAKAAYKYMLDHWVVDNGDGTMDWKGTVIVGTLDGAADFKQYISQEVDTNDLKGLAAFVLASIEYEKL
ncbi:Six-hairpin glycosidase [Fomitiporia mediterranea MF3/22]|uniref:Six-hairpin glycosidase n=1 Tax=Fomitiporia mediterranea (strain MF3/22) TaxID=694068 RepID=UPI00044083A9|nr:Six-hairpin glycosidase [Fomitiporia mediterranea MF3/22]EJD07837.1 Six-hairpin glycosidase [Fomitiporia mediterranea MF3/22]